MATGKYISGRKWLLVLPIYIYIYIYVVVSVLLILVETDICMQCDSTDLDETVYHSATGTTELADTHGN